MLKNIKERFLSISKSEFLLLEIPFMVAVLIMSLFIGGYLSTFNKPNNYFITTFILSFVASFYLIIRICKTKRNNEEKSFVNFLKTRSKKLIFLSLFLVWEFFNFTGFCYKEMGYLSDKELIDRVVAKQFVREDKREREMALNLKCTIRQGNLTESELDEKFTERKCGDSYYSSWGEFFQKGLEKKCFEDLDKYSTKGCGVVYYSSLEEFYKENPSCCVVHHVPTDRNGIPWEKWDIIFNNVLGFDNVSITFDKYFHTDSCGDNILLSVY